MTTIATHKDKESTIIRLINDGMKSWLEAATLLVELIDDDPSVIERLSTQDGSPPAHVYRVLERVGRKQMLPELMWKSGPGWNRLKNSPLSVQKRLVKEPVEVMIQTDKGYDTIQISIENLTPIQAKQVFNPYGEIRDASAQRAIIESERSIRIVKEPQNKRPWKVSGETLIVTTPCRIDLKEMGVIIAEMG